MSSRPKSAEPEIEARSESSPLLSNTTTPSRHLNDSVLPETAVIGRTLSFSSTYILVLWRVIGSGIFATPGTIVKTTGSIGLALLLWLFGACMAWCSVMITLEYGCMLPRSGGDKIYLEFTYPRPRFLASTLVAVQAVLLGFTASNCIIFGEYFLFAFGYEEATALAQKSWALSLLTDVTIVHGCFMQTGVRIQNFLGWLKIGLVLFMALTSVYVILFHIESPEADTVYASQLSWDGLFKDSNWGWGTISTAIFKVSYSYAGLQNVNSVLNEVRDPIRTLKTVAPAALLTAFLLYLLVNLAYFIVVPLDQVKKGGELIAALFFSQVFGEKFGKTILPLAIAISAAGNVMVVTFALARVNQEVARQGFLPYSRLLSSSKPFGAPLGGLIVHYIPSFIVIALPPRDDVYNFILDVESYPGQFAALATAVGLLWLRTKKSELKRPYKAFLPAVWLRIVICVALIAAPFFPPQNGQEPDVEFWYGTYAVVGIGIILLSILYWYVVFIVLPKWQGYRVTEEVEVLSDGTSVTKLIHVSI